MGTIEADTACRALEIAHALGPPEEWTETERSASTLRC